MRRRVRQRRRFRLRLRRSLQLCSSASSLVSLISKVWNLHFSPFPYWASALLTALRPSYVEPAWPPKLIGARRLFLAIRRGLIARQSAATSRVVCLHSAAHGSGRVFRRQGLSVKPGRSEAQDRAFDLVIWIRDCVSFQEWLASSLSRLETLFRKWPPNQFHRWRAGEDLIHH